MVYNNNNQIFNINEEFDYEKNYYQLLYMDISTLIVILTNQPNIPTSFFNDKKFIDKIISIPDIDDYRAIITKLSAKYDITPFEQKRKKYYQKAISSYDKTSKLIEPYLTLYNQLVSDNFDNFDNVDKYLTDNNLKHIYTTLHSIILTEEKQNIPWAILTYFKELSQIRIQEIIVDLVFQDLMLNPQLDINQLLSFEKKLPYQILKDETRTIYQKILRIDRLTDEELLDLYDEIKDMDLSTNLYEDIRTAKDIAYNKMKNVIISKPKLIKRLNRNLSKEHKVAIYELKGGPFYALVYATKYHKGDYGRLPKLTSFKYPGLSYSLIDQNHLTIFRDPKEYVALGFDDFDIDYISHVYHEDSYSDYDYSDEFHCPTDKVNEILLPENLMHNTLCQYNEIIIKSKIINKELFLYQNLIPKYLLCYDEVTQEDILYAKSNNLYIVLIHTKYYKNINCYLENNQSYLMYNSYSYQKKRLRKYSTNNM